MLTGKNLFVMRRGLDREQNRTTLLAQMVALLGPPPKAFLARPAKHSPYTWFDAEGIYLFIRRRNYSFE